MVTSRPYGVRHTNGFWSASRSINRSEQPSKMFKDFWFCLTKKPVQFATRTGFWSPHDQKWSSSHERILICLTTNRNGMCQSNGFQPYDNARFSHRAISITPPTRLQHASPSYTFTCFQWYTFANPANGGIDFVSKRENTRRERARFEQAGSAAPSARRFLYFSFSTFSLTT